MMAQAELDRRVWLVLTFGSDRSYGGNLGYEDDPRRLYRYDSDVQNHTRVRPGDVLVVRDRRSLLGLARVADVQSKAGTKTRQRCPTCRTATIVPRTTKRPPYRCAKGHEFADPLVETDDCVLYEAHLADFVDAVGLIPISTLRAACPRYAAQPSIQELDPDAVRWGLGEAAPRAAELLPSHSSADTGRVLSPDDADDGTGSPPPAASAKEESGSFGKVDERERVARAILVRRGQAAFRRALVRRYGARCMITGCELLDIIEAAHIAPYRARPDNAPVNGLLLRTDLHTLYDLDLLGIEPESMKVSLHPAAAAAGYEPLIGIRLTCEGVRPSIGAMHERWKRFGARLMDERSTAVGT